MTSNDIYTRDLRQTAQAFVALFKAFNTEILSQVDFGELAMDADQISIIHEMFTEFEKLNQISIAVIALYTGDTDDQ